MWTCFIWQCGFRLEMFSCLLHDKIWTEQWNMRITTQNTFQIGPTFPWVIPNFYSLKRSFFSPFFLKLELEKKTFCKPRSSHGSEQFFIRFSWTLNFSISTLIKAVFHKILQPNFKCLPFAKFINSPEVNRIIWSKTKSTTYLSDEKSKCINLVI